MFLRTGQGPKIRAEAGKPGPNTAHHSRGNGKQGTQPGAGSHNTAHAEMESKARNPGPGPHIAKGPAGKRGPFYFCNVKLFQQDFAG